MIYVEDMNYNFQADDEGSTPFIRSTKALQSDELFFLFKSSFYKDLDKKMQAFSGTKALICSTPNREACNNRAISKPMVKTMVKSMVITNRR